MRNFARTGRNFASFFTVRTHIVGMARFAKGVVLVGARILDGILFFIVDVEPDFTAGVVLS